MCLLKCFCNNRFTYSSCLALSGFDSEGQIWLFPCMSIHHWPSKVQGYTCTLQEQYVEFAILIDHGWYKYAEVRLLDLFLLYCWFTNISCLLLTVKDNCDNFTCVHQTWPSQVQGYSHVLYRSAWNIMMVFLSQICHFNLLINKRTEVYLLDIFSAIVHRYIMSDFDSEGQIWQLSCMSIRHDLHKLSSARIQA